FEIMHREPSIQDLPGAVAIERSAGEIRLENVTFRYRPELTPAVERLNLHIQPGKYYALVGSSGAGKSTILSLLLRFYDPNAGAAEGRPHPAAGRSHVGPGFGSGAGDSGGIRAPL